MGKRSSVFPANTEKTKNIAVASAIPPPVSTASRPSEDTLPAAAKQMPAITGKRNSAGRSICAEDAAYAD